MAVLFSQCSNKHVPFDGIRDYKITCKYFYNSTKEFWKLDSVGTNGFRYLAITQILNDCKLKGKSWDDYKDYFGTPRAKFGDNSHSTYYYTIYGIIRLIVKTDDKNTIKDIFVYFVDG